MTIPNRGLYRTPEELAHRDARIVAMTKQNFSVPEIMKALEVSNKTVNRVRHKYGLTKPPAEPLTEQEIETARRMIEDGASAKEVAISLGRSSHAILTRFGGWNRSQVGQYARMCDRFNSIRSQCG